MRLIAGKAIADRVKDAVAKNIHKLSGPRPNLAIILAGDRQDSALYVSLKEREAKLVGIDTHIYRLQDTDNEADLLTLIDFLNKDDLIDGILIQLPLPERFQTDKAIAALDPQKDVDGFCLHHPEYVISPVLAAVTASLDYTQVDYGNKRALVLHNSDVFGDSVVEMLEKRNIIAEKISVQGFDLLDDQTADALYQKVCAAGKQVDILVTALGLPRFVKKEMVKEGAIVIDIGIAKVAGKVYGDVDSDDIKNYAAWLTPVPGGIGPMTIAFLFKNVWEIYSRQKKKKD
ncbi:MAG TPA: bifunctional 5,10-methylenetetrahydrofolate dehydrogenase/5,10-methenyltetrahydrofolate cyclohydrolase [bacterium]|nr:bifunctional 5,10-methylenetetrahydrofolate dehydrogenase/5,10-methenyltetrahydrofolate cyclohydrolase [bacterium]HPT29771.1 bifunctional 5,10-methylenetetrahydrofolate dehydrogenase/5,10-methenyltetrahydrofolate cyclohydrolase [bacterium]